MLPEWAAENTAKCEEDWYEVRQLWGVDRTHSNVEEAGRDAEHDTHSLATLECNLLVFFPTFVAVEVVVILASLSIFL